ncbi:MAG: class I SAM-dependent methyltransferase [Actinomycetota bacterium]
MEATLAPALATVGDLELVVLVRIPSIWQDAGLSLPWSEVIDRLKSVGYYVADCDSDKAWDSIVFSRQVETDISVMFREKQGKLIDKWTSYLDRYSETLAPRLHSVRRLLEIGVQNGGSMDVWCQAFVNLDVAVGVDIDEKCGGLVYGDHRVNIVVGAAENAKTVNRILDISPEYDLIIDDGSHVSSHVIQNFLAYFPMLVGGGLYIVEDVHTSYWEKFGGGLSSRESQMAFFKSLTDVINHEHWADLAEILAVLPEESRETIRPDFEIPEALSKISEIRFMNSMVFIYKGNHKSELGARIVRGTEASVTDLAWHKRVGEGAYVTDMKHKAVW